MFSCACRLLRLCLVIPPVSPGYFYPHGVQLYLDLALGLATHCCKDCVERHLKLEYFDSRWQQTFAEVGYEGSLSEV